MSAFLNHFTLHRIKNGWLFLIMSMILPNISACFSNASKASESMPYRIDQIFSSENQQARVQFLVLHYTQAPFERSLELLTQTQYGVSAHYLVPEQTMEPDQPFPVYQLVPEDQRAYHAGVSFWQGARLLNSSSIGIEIVNLGFFPEDHELPLMARRWISYPETQLQTVGALARDIIARYEIPPHKVIGHSDIAPQRKIDPGPLFPWERLYREFNVGAWPDEDTVTFYINHFPYDGDIGMLQRKLADYGYEIEHNGNFDQAMQNVVAVFQMHFRPARYDGVPDVETVAILDALLEKYQNIKRPTL